MSLVNQGKFFNVLAKAVCKGSTISTSLASFVKGFKNVLPNRPSMVSCGRRRYFLQNLSLDSIFVQISIDSSGLVIAAIRYKSEASGS